MLVGDYEDELTEYVFDENIPAANEVLMRQLANSLVDDKQNFIDLLNENGIEADKTMPNSQLIELFINNTHDKDLLIGAALLVELNKKKIGFDGEQHINDTNVKTGVAVMDSYFNDVVPNETYSYIAPFLIGALAKGATRLIKNKNNKRSGGGKRRSSMDDEMRRIAEFKMKQQALYRQKLELERIQREAKQKQRKRKKRNAIIIGVSSVVLLVTGIIVYKKMKR